MDKITKAFIALNKNIDTELEKSYQKLYDKFLVLQLSHNRKKKALKRLRQFFADCKSEVVRIGHADASLGDLEQALKIIDDALFCDGRLNCPCINGKEKGEKR